MKLPEEYYSWLETIDTDAEHRYRNIIIKSYSMPGLQNKNRLFNKFFNENIFINNIIELKAEELESNNTYTFTKERTGKCIAIGESNRNFIFVDPLDDFSICILILSNKCIFKESGNIHDIIKFTQSYDA